MLTINELLLPEELPERLPSEVRYLESPLNGATWTSYSRDEFLGFDVLKSHTRKLFRFLMLFEVSMIICSICLVNKGRLLLTKDASQVGDDVQASCVIVLPSAILLFMWIVDSGYSNFLMPYLHHADVFLQAFFVIKVVLYLRQCGMWGQISRALNSYALLFLNVCYC